MANPTQVFKEYLQEHHELEPDRVLRTLRWGRIAMGLEIVSLIRLIEDHSILASKEETISVLRTLLQDQGLEDISLRWYERLSDWRKPKFSVIDGGASDDASASFHEVRPGVWLRRHSTDAPLGDDQSQDPPST